MTSRNYLRAMQTGASVAAKNSLAIALILIASGCKDEKRDEFVISDRFSLCAPNEEIISTSLKNGIDATKGDIWIGRDKAEIVIDAHPYYPLREKVKSHVSSEPGVTPIDTGRYTSPGAPGEREFNLSSYRLQDGRNVFVVLSGASDNTTRESLINIQRKLCPCGSC